MKKKSISSLLFVVFSALVQSAIAANAVCVVCNGNANENQMVSATQTATAGDYTIRVNTILANWDIAGVYNMQQQTCWTHVLSGTGGCYEEATWSWKSETELKVGYKEGKSAICILVKPLIYSIGFDANGGEGLMTSMTELSVANSSVTLDANAFWRTGYEFQGWTVDAANKKTLIADQASLSTVLSNVTTRSSTNLTLYAKWTAHSYQVSYDLDGGTTDASLPTTAVNGTPFQVSRPTRTGYVFTGWVLDGDYSSDTACWGTSKQATMSAFEDAGEGYMAAATGSSAYFLDLASEDNASVKLIAQWKAIKINVVIDLGDSITTNIVGYADREEGDGQAFAIDIPERTGYVFEGWKVKGHNSSTARYGFSEDAESCTMAFPAGTTAIFTKDTFGGTFKDFYVTHLSLKDGATVTFTAQWTKNTYTIEYYDEDEVTPIYDKGVPRSETSATYDTAYKVSQPTRKGYTFAGWRLLGGDYDLWTARCGVSSTDCETEFTDGIAVPNSAYKYLYVKNLASVEDGTTVKLIAQWRPYETIVTVKSDDTADATSTTNTAYYGTPFELAVPERAGYTFIGWKASGLASTVTYGLDKDSCDKPITGIMTTNVISTTESVIYLKNLTEQNGASVTFTALWQVSVYNIIYDDNGGTHDASASRPETATFGDPLFLVTAPTKLGCSFKGWLVTGEYDPKTFYSEVIDDETSREVTFEGTTINASSDIWFQNMASKDGAAVYLTAQWTANETMVTVVDADGKSSSYTNVYGNVVEILSPTNRTGYAFKGWQVEGYDPATARYGRNETDVETAFPTDGFIAETNTIYVKNLTTNNNASVTFTAKWQVGVYNIIYDDNGGTHDASASRPAKASYFKAFFVSTPTKKGYTFTGWKVSNYDASTALYGSDDTCEEALVNSQTPASDLFFLNLTTKNEGVVTLTACWELSASSYLVTYDENGGVSGRDRVEKLAYGKAYLITAPTRMGYAFTGWKVSGYEATTARYGLGESCASDFPANGILVAKTDIYVKDLSLEGKTVAFVAQWKPIEYGIMYNENGGTAGASRPLKAAYDKAVAIDPPTKVGYAFKGWQVSGYDASTAKYGIGDQTCPTAIPSTGKIDCTGTIYVKNLTTTANARVQITAIWSDASSGISYELGGGTAGTSSPTTFAHGTVAKIDAPAKAGFKFFGWNVANCSDDACWGLDASCDQAIPTNGLIKALNAAIYVKNFGSASSPVKMTAVWGVEVAFNANGGTVDPASQTYGIGLAYDELPTPTAASEEQTFVGWFTELTGGDEIASETVVKESVTTLYAHWAGMYKVVFNSNDGTRATTTQKLPIGTATALMANTFVRTGWTFQGWAKTLDASVCQYADGEFVKDLAAAGGIIDLYAVWKVNEYTVAFDANGGSGTMSSTSVAYGVSFALPANGFDAPVSATFDHWELGGAVYAAGASVSNLTAVADATVTFYAAWKLSLTDLSTALDCSSLLWSNRNESASAKWEVHEGDGYESSSCVRQNNAIRGDRTPLVAKLTNGSTTSGMLTFMWKPATSSSQLEWYLSDAEGSFDGTTTTIKASGTNNWQKVTAEIKESGFVYFVLKNMSPKDEGVYELIDKVVWTSAGSASSSSVFATPTVMGDAGSTVTGGMTSGYTITPSEGLEDVSVSIPSGLKAEKVTVQVKASVKTVKTSGAKLKVMSASGSDITSYLDMPAVDATGIVDLSKAMVKDEIVKEVLDPNKGAEVEMNAAEPKITTSATKPGLTYTLVEGATLDGMKDGVSTVGDGKAWTPVLKVKGGTSGFYMIKVTK